MVHVRESLDNQLTQMAEVDTKPVTFRDVECPEDKFVAAKKALMTTKGMCLFLSIKSFAPHGRTFSEAS